MLNGCVSGSHPTVPFKISLIVPANASKTVGYAGGAVFGNSLTSHRTGHRGADRAPGIAVALTPQPLPQIDSFRGAFARAFFLFELGIECRGEGALQARVGD